MGSLFRTHITLAQAKMSKKNEEYLGFSFFGKRIIRKKSLLVSKSTRVYYHYTDEESAKAIKKDGNIRKSTDTKKDAVLGEGTYVTKMPPTKSTTTIAINNYDGAATRAIADKKMDGVFAMKLKPDAAKSLKKMNGRDVYCFPGKDINFTEDCDKVEKYRRSKPKK